MELGGSCRNYEDYDRDHGVLELPPGFRFHPTDEEIIIDYLLNKVIDSDFTAIAIAEADLNKCEPWDLPYKAKMGEKEWFFFYQRDRKYPTGMRTNRATETGYWKATGKDKEIFNKTRGVSKNASLVGMKKTLVFYKGRAPKGEKTNWVMHEYRLEGNHNLSRTAKDQWVVCRVILKNEVGILARRSQATAGGMELARIDSFVNHLLDDDDDATLTLPPLLTGFSNSYHGHDEVIEPSGNKNNNSVPSSSSSLLFTINPKPEMFAPQFDGQNPNFILPPDAHQMNNPMFYHGFAHNQTSSVFEYCGHFPFKNAYSQENLSYQPPNNSTISHSQDTGVSDFNGKAGNSEITSPMHSIKESKTKTEVDEELEGISFSPNISELDSLWSYR